MSGRKEAAKDEVPNKGGRRSTDSVRHFLQFLYVGTDCFCQMQRCESPAQSGARAKLRAKPTFNAEKARMKFAIGCKASELLFESDFFPASFYLETSSAVTFYFF